MTLTYAAGDTPYKAELNNWLNSCRGQGVFSGGAVSQRAAGANMSVDVATYVAYFIDAGDANRYRRGATGAQNLVIGAADPTNARYDLIVITRTLTTPFLQVVAGTAGANPFPPALPADSIALAVVQVPAGATSIVDAYVRDTRVNVPLPPRKLLHVNMTVIDDTGGTYNTEATAKSYAVSANAVCEQLEIEFDVGGYENAFITTGNWDVAALIKISSTQYGDAAIVRFESSGNVASNQSDTGMGSGNGFVKIAYSDSSINFESAQTVLLRLDSGKNQSAPTGIQNCKFVVWGI